MNANAGAESSTLEWCGVGSCGGRGWRPEQARSIRGRECSNNWCRGGEVGSRALGGKERDPFLSVVDVCSGCLNVGLKGSNLIFLPLCTNWHMLDRP